MGKKPRVPLVVGVLKALFLHPFKRRLLHAALYASKPLLPDLRLSGRSNCFSSRTFITAKTLPFNFESSDPRLKCPFLAKRRPLSTRPATAHCSSEKPISNPAPEMEPHLNSVPNSFSGIGRSVISRCSHVWTKKDDGFQEISCLQDLLKLYGNLSPETTRRFWRVSVLKPQDFLEILLGFGFNVVNPRKVEFCWKLFRWAAEQSREFCHIPRSYEIMISMLVDSRNLGGAESLILSAEANGVTSGASAMYAKIIEGYIEAGELEKPVALYNQARNRCLILSDSCHRALLNLLIRMEKPELALRVYMDMMEVGSLRLSSEGHFLNYVVGYLSKAGKILEAVKIIRKVRDVGGVPSPLALTAIVKGYNRKRDFEDMMNFLEEWQHIPEARVCNRIVSDLCRYLGVEEAWRFVQRMEVLGFRPDDVTVGILIGRSCRERNLRSAFIYLSEGFSRGIGLKVDTYNALISGIFKEGMYWCVKDVLDDMVDKGLVPDSSTFRVLLAGYCRYKKFDEVKKIVSEMATLGSISIDPPKDALSKAFTMLGLDRLGVKVKRDNTVGFAKAEFFDSLGNGLYLETNVDEYERTLTSILDFAMLPDFDSILRKECGCGPCGDLEAALRVKDEAVQWGHNISSSTYIELLKILSISHVKEAIYLLDEMPEISDKLDHEIINRLVRTLAKNGRTVHARSMFERLLQQELLVDSDTYTTLIMASCEERDMYGLRECLELTQRIPCPLQPEAIETLIRSLCKRGMINEMLEFFDNTIERCPDFVNYYYNAILKELCTAGFTCVGLIFVKEVLQRGLVLDHRAYMILIKGCVKEQMFAEVIGIFDKLQQNKVSLNSNVYRHLIHSLFRLNKVWEAAFLKRSVLNIEAVGAIYNPLVSELCRIRNIKEATFELREMLVNKMFPDSNTLNSLVQGYCRENNLGKAFEILCIMLRKHIDVSIPCYRSLVRKMCITGKGLHVLRFMEMIHRMNESQLLILYNILIFSLFQMRNSSSVEFVLKSMHEKHLNPDASTYDFLIYGFDKCQYFSESESTLSTMIIKGLTPSSRSLRTVICYLCSHGELLKAFDFSRVMECRGWKHSSVVQTAITGVLLSHGRIFEAELFLSRMEAKDLIADKINYDLLITRLCLNGSVYKAIDLINIMLKRDTHPSERSYDSVILGLSNCKAFDQSLDFLAEMQHRNFKPSVDSCDALVYGLCCNGRTDDARSILRTMLQYGPTPTQRMYNNVIERYYNENNLADAVEVLHEMQQAGYSPNFEIHWSIVSSLSCCNGKNDDGDGGKGFLSGLLSDSIPPVKNYKCKGAPMFNYASFLP